MQRREEREGKGGRRGENRIEEESGRPGSWRKRRVARRKGYKKD